jgi:predicted PurR-regulated permease PerM
VAFLVAVFLAMLGTPPVLWLERKRHPLSQCCSWWPA